MSESYCWELPAEFWYAMMKPAVAPRVRPAHMEDIRILDGVPTEHWAIAYGMTRHSCRLIRVTVAPGKLTFGLAQHCAALEQLLTYKVSERGTEG